MVRLACSVSYLMRLITPIMMVGSVKVLLFIHITPSEKKKEMNPEDMKGFFVVHHHNKSFTCK
jgi:hypothetical protein